MDETTPHNDPHIVSVKDFKIDADYAAWLSEIKRRYISAQIKASVKINTEKLQFNWSIGQDLVKRKAEERWGNGVVEQLSFDLQEAFPQEKGFGTTNAVDELLKGPDDNPTIGLLICSDKEENEVRWAFKGIQTPMGVASYDNVQIEPSNLLPSAEELQTRVRLVEEELNSKNKD